MENFSKVKRFNIMHNVGKCKYVVNYHDGIKEHKDHSDFFDISIFKNKKKLTAFVKSLLKQGYAHPYINLFPL